MKIAIFSFNYPWNEVFVSSTETARLYCNKYNIDYHLFTEPKVNWKHYYCERFYIAELLREYDRVLYLDADIVVTPTAENIFDIVPLEFFGAFHESRSYDVMNRNPMVESLLHFCPDWPKIGKQYRFFNAGVMLASKSHLFAFDKFREKAPEDLVFWQHWPDQTYLNYLVTYAVLPFYDITSKFNLMSMGVKRSREERFSGSFIHYAGSTDFYEGDKYEIMEEDVRILYGKA